MSSSRLRFPSRKVLVAALAAAVCLAFMPQALAAPAAPAAHTVRHDKPIIWSPTLLAQAGYRAGIRDKTALTTAVAIALAESGGDINAVGDEALADATYDPSFGAWQIRCKKAQRHTGKPHDMFANVEPTFNASAMYSISKGGTYWTPWTMYKNGHYRDFWAKAQKGVKNFGNSPGVHLT